MKVIGIQIDTVWEDKPASHARVETLLGDIDIARGTLIVLPEMFATGFSPDVSKIAEAAGDGPTQTFLSGLAARRKAFVLGGVVTHGEAGRGRNEAVVYGPDGAELVRYQKLFPFTFGKETDHYGRGDTTARFECGDFKVAPFVCYDLRFPEVFRIEARRGAELYAVIANWPAARQDHWMALLRARAIENQAFVIGVNRCGRDPKHSYSGRSQIIDPRGRVLADAGQSEGLVRAELNRAELVEYRATFPALSDVRDEYLADDA